MFLEGFVLGFSLIAAIGPQNAFVLRQGLAKQHVFLSAFSTSFCDTVLILISVMGAGRYLAEHETLKLILTLGGIGFLAVYAIQSFRSVFKTQKFDLKNGSFVQSYASIVLKAIGFSWINPHAILDVVVVMGSISAKYDNHGACLFGLGCIAVSFLWFFVLAYGAKRLSHHFQKPIVWKVIDFIVGCMCLWISGSLIKDLLQG